MDDLLMNYFGVLLASKVHGEATVENTEGCKLVAVYYHVGMKQVSLAFEGEDVTSEANLAPGWKQLWRRPQ